MGDRFYWMARWIVIPLGGGWLPAVPERLRTSSAACAKRRGKLCLIQSFRTARDSGFAPGLMPARIPSRSVFGGRFSAFRFFLVEAFMHAGLLFGHDSGLGLGHARIGQALDEAFGIEDGGFCF